MTVRPFELDLTLAETPVHRWFGWLVGLLAALAVLALALVAVADARLRALALRPLVVTVALPPEAAKDATVLEALARLPGVLAADPVPEAELGELLAVTREGGEPALPLPRLVDLVFRPGVAPDLATLRQRLRELAPGAVASAAAAEGAVDGGRARAEALRLMGLVVLAVVLVAAMLCAAVMVRTHVRLQAATVDVLRLMGASDRYIARQFEQLVLARGLVAALLGFLAAVAVFLLAAQLARARWPELVGELALRPLDWIALAAVPVVLVVLLALVARLTARRMLARPLAV